MNKESGHTIAAAALLLLLVVFILLVAKRRDLRVEEAEDDTVQTVVRVENTVVHDKYAASALLATLALFAFVIWTVLRGKSGEDPAKPPAQESSGDGTREFLS
jgi:hypothetical protein